MLKFIYKIMLVSILSGSLLMMDFSFKGQLLQSAHAESVKTEGIKDGGMMATLTMTAVGLLASRLYRYKITPDMMVAAAGGVAFLAGEVMAASALKKVAKDLETEIKRDDKGKIETKQIETLEKLKQSYVEARKTANTKKTLQQAAAAAFAAAGIMAYFFSAQEEAAFATCSAAVSAATGGGLSTCLTSSAASCAGPQYGACYPPLAAICNACAANINANFTALTAKKVARDAPQPSMSGSVSDKAATTTLTSGYAASSGTCSSSQSAPMAAAEKASCPSVIPIHEMNNSYGVATAMASLPNSSDQMIATIIPGHQLESRKALSDYVRVDSYFERMASIFISEARADLFSPMGIASSVAISFVLATNTALAIELDMLLLNPKNRGIAFGVLAALTFAASSATDQAIAKIDANISKIDAILNGLYSYANGAVATNPTITKPKINSTKPESFKLDGLNPSGNESVDISSHVGGSLPCFTKEASGKCPEFGADVIGSPSFTSLPAGAQTQVKQFAALANGFNRTKVIKGATLDTAAKIAASANALRGNLNKAKKQIEETLKKKDKNINLEQESKNFEEKIRGTVIKQLKKSNMSAGEMLASFGGGSMYNTGGEKPDASIAQESSDKNNAVVAGAIDISAVSSTQSADLGLGEESSNELTDEEKAQQDAIASAANASGPSIDEYDLKNDISKDKESSLFELISNRYQKSGYQRLFKRK